MSHQEIATALGITQQAVSKIEKRALAKARAALEAAGLSRADAGDEAWIIPAQGMRP